MLIIILPLRNFLLYYYHFHYGLTLSLSLSLARSFVGASKFVIITPIFSMLLIISSSWTFSVASEKEIRSGKTESKKAKHKLQACSVAHRMSSKNEGEAKTTSTHADTFLAPHRFGGNAHKKARETESIMKVMILLSTRVLL